MTEPRLPMTASSSGLSAELQAELAELMDTGMKLRDQRHADNTREAYLSDFAHFAGWWACRSIEALPAQPGTVWLYLTALVEGDNAADYKVATFERRLPAIKWVHVIHGHPAPTSHTEIRELMAGIRRRLKVRPDKVDRLTTDQVRAIVSVLDLDTLTGLRDRVLLLLGYAGGFRRSELVGLERRQLRRTSDGYVLEFLGSKDDQEGKGRSVGIPAFPGSPLCPVAAIDAWLVVAAISDGPIFRKVTRYKTITTRALTGAAVAQIIRRVAAGIPADNLLRAGHATTAALKQAPDRSIMRQTGHKRAETLDGYVRPATVFIDNSATYLGPDTNG